MIFVLATSHLPTGGVNHPFSIVIVKLNFEQIHECLSPTLVKMYWDDGSGIVTGCATSGGYHMQASN